MKQSRPMQIGFGWPPSSKKFFRIMKLATFFLLIGWMQVSATAYSQEKLITLSLKDASLPTVFSAIAKQSDYLFLYNNDNLNNTSPKVNVEVKEATIEQVMAQCLNGLPFSYKIMDKTVVIIPKHNTAAKQQLSKVIKQMQVSGRVTDSTGAPLIGVSVKIKGANKGAITNDDGRFQLELQDENAVLVFSYVGYKTKEVQVNGRSMLNITLESSSSELNQLIVVGYGTKKKVNLTGAVSVINAEDISKRTVNNSVQALRGLAPNLNIGLTNNGGASDATMSLNIRGVGSLSSSAPYILIDGVRATQAELSALNPINIESISVLKDAASAAIYGAQAAYGVILVKTKTGRQNQKLSVGISSSLRLSKLIFVPSSLDALTYAKEINQASQNYANQTFIPEEQIEKIKAFMNGELKYGTAPVPNAPNQWLGIGEGRSSDWYSGFANTDWWDVMYKDFGFTQKHDVFVSGGTKKLTYYASGGFFQDPGQFYYGDKNENFRRLNYNSTISADVTDWLTISNVTRFYQVNNIFPATLEAGSRGRLFHDMMRWSPLVPLKTPPVKDSAGNIIVPEQLTTLAGYNENNGFNKYQINNLVSTFKADVKITDHLSIKGDYTFKKDWYERTLNYKKWIFYGPQGEPSLIYQANNNQIKKEWRRTNYTSINVYANYDRSFSAHNFHLLVGYQQEENNHEKLQVGRKAVIADYLNSINVSVGDIIDLDNPISAWGTMGVFGRLSYNYQEKYIFEFNGRYDGSSKFAPHHRWGFFPSVSLGYNIYKEKFWESLSPVINTLKIRASYGKLGNQNVDGYLYLPSIPINTELNWAIGGERPVYTKIPGIISPDITWETSTTKNLGFDLTFLNNRLSASIDIYQRQTDNMFGPSSALPAALGTDPPQTNSASLSTKGFELVIGWRDAVQDFNYNINLMLSDNVSTITQYNNSTNVLKTDSWYVGQTIGEIWGFKANELFQSESEVEKYTSQVDLSYFGTGWQPGDVKYLDLNGDGKVDVGENTVDNPGDRIIIGNDHPRYHISLSAGASWKNFDFQMLWQGIGKRDLFLDSYASLFWGWNSQGHSHLTKASLDHWSKDNPGGYLPIPLLSGGRSGFGKDRYPSTRYLLNGAYIRLKSLNIGYTLPASLTKRIKINSVRFFIGGENLLTFTNMWPTLDPEIAYVGKKDRTSDGRAYPLSQVYTFGFNITF